MAGLVIVGTGGMGREAAGWATAQHGEGAVRGFLDADPERRGTIVVGLPVLGALAEMADELCERGDEVAIAIGAPLARTRVLGEVRALRLRPSTVLDPRAVIGPRTSVGEGSIICPGVILTCDVTVEDAVIVNYGALVGHDCVLGEASFIAPGVHLAGNVTVGARADIGIGASVVQGVTIGEDAVVGAGAVVIRDVPAGAKVVGVPARPIGGGAA
ncbi:MAG: acetyltransferase [Nitriliruptoraceae bacterium]|nr:acetyltransferase [Nitriliruptoraceae bacterium]